MDIKYILIMNCKKTKNYNKLSKNKMDKLKQIIGEFEYHEKKNCEFFVGKNVKISSELDKIKLEFMDNPFQINMNDILSIINKNNFINIEYSIVINIKTSGSFEEFVENNKIQHIISYNKILSSAITTKLDFVLPMGKSQKAIAVNIELFPHTYRLNFKSFSEFEDDMEYIETFHIMFDSQIVQCIINSFNGDDINDSKKRNR
jgi:hypothetical protein